MKLKLSVIGFLCISNSYAVMNLMCEDFAVNTYENTALDGTNNYDKFGGTAEFVNHKHPYYSDQNFDITSTTDPQSSYGLYMGQARRKDSNDIIHYWCYQYHDCSSKVVKTENKRDMCPSGYSGSVLYQRTYSGKGKLNRRLYKGTEEECLAHFGLGTPGPWVKVAEDCVRIDNTSGDTDTDKQVCNTIAIFPQKKYGGGNLYARQRITKDTTCPAGQFGTAYSNYYRKASRDKAQSDSACDASLGPEVAYGDYSDCRAVPALTTNTCEGWRTLDPNGTKADRSAEGAKYTFIPTDKVTYNGETLTRICMLAPHIDSDRVNMSYSAIRGDKGGYIREKENLSYDVNDKAWIGTNTYVAGGHIKGRVFIIGESRITGDNQLSNLNRSGEYTDITVTGSNTIEDLGFLTSSEINGTNTIKGRINGVSNEISNAAIDGNNRIELTDIDRNKKANYRNDTKSLGILTRISGVNTIINNTEPENEKYDLLYISKSTITGRNHIEGSRVDRSTVGGDPATGKVNILNSNIRSANILKNARINNSNVLAGTTVTDNAQVLNVNYRILGYRLNFIGGSSGSSVLVKDDALIDLARCDTSKFQYSIETTDKTLRQLLPTNTNGGKFLVINRNAEVSGDGKVYCGFVEGNARVISGGVVNGQLRNKEVINTNINSNVNLKVYVKTNTDGSVIMNATSSETEE